ncbi:right-handed parallel beta-helix repeat-containing protein [bacterium]|nr:MAG: right-handed parallel beta-helix repeat-containing protein [bacterium]
MLFPPASRRFHVAICLSTLLVCGTPFLTPPVMAAPKTVLSLSDFGARPNSGADATPAFQAAFAAVAKHPEGAVLRIPKGRYDLFPAQASKRPCFASNATESNSDGTRTIALDLRSLKNLSIEGNGSLLMMRGNMTLLVAENCENLTVSNLAFDFLRPTVSELTIREKGDGFFTAQIHPDSKYEIVNGNSIRWIGEGWTRSHNLWQIFDPTTERVWRAGNPLANMKKIEQIGPGLLRFEPAQLTSLQVGQVLQGRDTTRDQVGMWLNHSKNLTLRDVKIHFMAGFGLLSQFSENLNFERLQVAPAPQSGRTCAVAADVLHFSGCKGRITVRDSLLSAANDDALNVHGTHLRIIEKPAPNQILVRFMHPQTWGFQAYFPGDEVSFVHPDTMKNFGDTKVLAAEMKSPREQLLTLAAPIPAEVVLNSDCLENTTWTPSVEVTNCDIKHIPTRGFLLTSRRPLLIQNNRFFRTNDPAILVENDASGWYESGPVRDLTIKNNSFIQCGEPAIDIHNRNHSGIKIIGNTFTLKDDRAIRAIGVAGLHLSNNTVKIKPTPLFDTTESSAVMLKDNSITLAP